jgi:hypothetical protein
MPAQKPRDERTGGVGGIGRRLDRLEAGAGRPCGECGHAPGRFVEYDAVWIDAPDDGSVEDGGPDCCPACGRRLVHDVTWADVGGRGGS